MSQNTSYPVVVIFRSRLIETAKSEYYSLAPQIAELAKEMPGYIHHKTYVSEDQERVTIVEFESEEHLNTWKRHPEHVAAKKRGINEFFECYNVQTLKVLGQRSRNWNTV